MRIIPVVFSLLTLCSTAQCKDAPSSEEASRQQIVQLIERDLPSFPENGKLSDYRRFYAFSRTRGRSRPVVVAVYLSGERAGTEWRTEQKLPLVMDGGCSVITMVFDLKSKKIVVFQCNGVA